MELISYFHIRSIPTFDLDWNTLPQYHFGRFAMTDTEFSKNKFLNGVQKGNKIDFPQWQFLYFMIDILQHQNKRSFGGRLFILEICRFRDIDNLIFSFNNFYTLSFSWTLSWIGRYWTTMKCRNLPLAISKFQ